MLLLLPLRSSYLAPDNLMLELIKGDAGELTLAKVRLCWCCDCVINVIIVVVVVMVVFNFTRE